MWVEYYSARIASYILGMPPTHYVSHALLLGIFRKTRRKNNISVSEKTFESEKESFEFEKNI